MKKGLFWCVDYDSEKPTLIIKAVDCDISGRAITDNVEYTSKSGGNFNHKIEWNRLSKNITQGKAYNYYPRGRVEINNSKISIFLNSDINKDAVIRKIIEEFDLEMIEDIRIISDGSRHYRYYGQK